MIQFIGNIQNEQIRKDRKWVSTYPGLEWGGLGRPAGTDEQIGNFLLGW